MYKLMLTLVGVAAMCSLVIAEEPGIIDVSDKAAIDAAMGKEVTVQGTIANAAWSRTGKVMNIEFENATESGMRAALFEKHRREFDDAFGGDVAKTLTGAKVRIDGKLQEFKEKPEIVLNEPGQLTILEQAPTTQPQ